MPGSNFCLSSSVIVTEKNVSLIIILTCVNWYVLMVLTRISLEVSNVDLAGYFIYPLLKKRSQSFCLVFNLVVFLFLICTSSFCILDINPFSYIRFANILSCRLEVDFIVISI